MTDSNQHPLWAVNKKMDEDYAPYGLVERQNNPDCSQGCRFFGRLATAGWGVCAGPRSHRQGLLTFEHQGCLEGFERGESIFREGVMTGGDQSQTSETA